MELFAVSAWNGLLLNGLKAAAACARGVCVCVCSGEPAVCGPCVLRSGGRQVQYDHARALDAYHTHAPPTPHVAVIWAWAAMYDFQSPPVGAMAWELPIPSGIHDPFVLMVPFWRCMGWLAGVEASEVACVRRVGFT